MICLVRYSPRARDGYIFGYKDMHEAMGPCESQCPQPILELLTASDNDQALAWRERCRANNAARKEQSAKPKPRPGQTIVFQTPIAFRGGRVFEQLEVAAYAASHRTVVFRDPGGGGLYRVPNLKSHDYRLIDPPDH
jgi:hypothetical protein